MIVKAYILNVNQENKLDLRVKQNNPDSPKLIRGLEKEDTTQDFSDLLVV